MIGNKQRHAKGFFFPRRLRHLSVQKKKFPISIRRDLDFGPITTSLSPVFLRVDNLERLLESALLNSCVEEFRTACFDFGGQANAGARALKKKFLDISLTALRRLENKDEFLGKKILKTIS